MARCIDADALIEALQADFDREGAKADDMAMRGLTDLSVKYNHGQFCFLNAIEQVKIIPTADVVPKSELEKLQAEVQGLRNANADLSLALLYECAPTKEHLSELEKAVREKVAREIFEEIEKRSSMWGGERHINYKTFAKLKKKYTEEQSDG